MDLIHYEAAIGFQSAAERLKTPLAEGLPALKAFVAEASETLTAAHTAIHAGLRRSAVEPWNAMRLDMASNDIQHAVKLLKEATLALEGVRV